MSNATGHLSLLLTQVKGCVLSLQLLCHQIAPDRPWQGSEEDFFLGSFYPLDHYKANTCSLWLWLGNVFSFSKEPKIISGFHLDYREPYLSPVIYVHPQ